MLQRKLKKKAENVETGQQKAKEEEEREVGEARQERKHLHQLLQQQYQKL